MLVRHCQLVDHRVGSAATKYFDVVEFFTTYLQRSDVLFTRVGKNSSARTDARSLNWKQGDISCVKIVVVVRDPYSHHA
jgi:hypothetical protein